MFVVRAGNLVERVGCGVHCGVEVRGRIAVERRREWRGRVLRIAIASLKLWTARRRFIVNQLVGVWLCFAFEGLALLKLPRVRRVGGYNIGPRPDHLGKLPELLLLRSKSGNKVHGACYLFLTRWGRNGGGFGSYQLFCIVISKDGNQPLFIY